MGFNFPDTPTNGQKFAPSGGPVWQWSSADSAWKAVGGIGLGQIYISDTAPTGAVDGSLWWESDTGMLYIRYNDGDSSQWVAAVPVSDATTYAVRFDTAQALTFDSGLTLGQRSQARSNIAAAPFDAMAYNGLQLNGACEVSQERGNVSFAVPMNSTVVYVQDQWHVVCNAAATLAITAFPFNSGGPPGLPYNFALLASTGLASLAAGDFVAFGHVIEGTRLRRLNWGTVYAQPLSIGCWFLTTTPGVMTISARNPGYTRSYIVEQTLGSGWNFVTCTIPGCTDGTWPIDNSAGLVLTWGIAAGSTFKVGTPNVWTNTGNFTTAAIANMVPVNGSGIYVTGLVILPGLELPSIQRSPYITRPYAQELELCKRYFYSNAATGIPALGLTDGASIFIGNPEMRATPTITHPFTDAGYTTIGSPGAGQWNLQQPGVAVATKTGTASFGVTGSGLPNGAIIYVTGCTFSRQTTLIAVGSGMAPIRCSARML